MEAYNCMNGCVCVCVCVCVYAHVHVHLCVGDLNPGLKFCFLLTYSKAHLILNRCNEIFKKP